MSKFLGFAFISATLGFGNALWAQTQPVLTLASGTATAGGTVALNLSLSSPSGSLPAAVQWTLTYPAASVASISVTAGAAATAAGKSIACSGGATAYLCVVSGMNANTIANGVVAVVMATLTNGATTAAIGIASVEGASTIGEPITVSATGGTITIPLAVSSLTCSLTSLVSAGSSTCTVTLNSPAGTGGAAITLSSSAAGLTVPASVTVAAGSSTATFTATAGTITSAGTATVKATLSGSSASATIALTAPAAVTVSALHCTATSLGQNASTSCTVTLSQAAPAGGVSVSLSSSAAALTVPASVSVPVGASSATFTIGTGATASAQTATLSASASGSPAISLSIALTVPTVPVTTSPTVTPLNTQLLLTGSATEVAGSKTGSAITPAVAPAGLAGQVVVNGSGSVNFVAGSGVYFLNCCANTNNAYYKFTGAALAGVFGIPQGQISFTLKSRYTFAQRQSTAAAQRYAFDARDGSGLHQFYFYTQVVSGDLVFYYGVGGTALSYTVPKGTEDQLFGSGISLNVYLSWNGSTASLYLNGVPVKSSAYVPATSTWNTSSNFDLGAYEYLTSGGYNVLDDVIGNFSVASPALLLIHSNSNETAGTANGSAVMPSTAPSNLAGKVVVNGSGSVNFVAGSGVYFLNCCANTNNAYYKFTGAALAGIFGIPQGQISFTLKSRYTFAQRQTTTNQRYAFDARDGGGTHQFYFYTQVVSGSLVFYYEIGGASLYYYVPKGTEDQLFGNGVSLNVLLGWDGSTASLYLNGVPVKSASYVPAKSTWNTSSNFDLGAYEYLTAGGYNSSDDLIRDFTVIGPPVKSGGSLSSGIALPGLGSGRTRGARGSGSLSSAVSAPTGASLSCDSSVTAGSSALCELRLDSSANPDSTTFSLDAGSEHVLVPATVTTRAGQTRIHFEVLTDAETPQGAVVVAARSNATATQASLSVVRDGAPTLLVAGARTGTPGVPLRFDILSGGQQPQATYASGLPSGASFDSTTGAFAWLPSEQDLGLHSVVFTATNSLGLSTSKTVAVNIVRPAQSAAPAILTVGDSDQALALHAGSSMLAAIPSVRFDGQPAQPGDLLSIAVAGIDCNQAGNLRVRFGSGFASIVSIEPAGGTTSGVCRIAVEVPSGVTAPRAPITIEMTGADGRVLTSNTASVAVEN